MKCSKCGKNHHESYHLKSSIKDKGYPTSEGSRYERAHASANKAEKNRFPRGFEELKALDISLGKKHELAGKSTKAGKIEVSKKVPKNLRSEVKFHEKVESKALGKNNARKNKKG